MCVFICEFLSPDDLHTAQNKSSKSKRGSTQMCDASINYFCSPAVSKSWHTFRRLRSERRESLFPNPLWSFLRQKNHKELNWDCGSPMKSRVGGFDTGILKRQFTEKLNCQSFTHLMLFQTCITFLFSMENKRISLVERS